MYYPERASGDEKLPTVACVILWCGDRLFGRWVVSAVGNCWSTRCFEVYRVGSVLLTMEVFGGTLTVGEAEKVRQCYVTLLPPSSPQWNT